MIEMMESESVRFHIIKTDKILSLISSLFRYYYAQEKVNQTFHWAELVLFFLLSSSFSFGGRIEYLSYLALHNLFSLMF